MTSMDGGTDEQHPASALAGLTRRMAEGDDGAWHQFHDRYYVFLLRYATHRSGDSSAADEVVQQAYLRIARHVRPFENDENFRGWLCCVVRCAALDHVRHITRRALLLEKFAHWRAAISGADRNVASENCNEALAEEALSKLPEADAALLRRKYWDGCSTLEMANSLGTSTKAVEHRLARLRERLREIILRLP